MSRHDRNFDRFHRFDRYRWYNGYGYVEPVVEVPVVAPVCPTCAAVPATPTCTACAPAVAVVTPEVIPTWGYGYGRYRKFDHDRHLEVEFISRAPRAVSARHHDNDLRSGVCDLLRRRAKRRLAGTS